MASKTRFTASESSDAAQPLYGPPCECLAEFFRQEFRKHRECLDRHREYYSAPAIAQAEDALARILQSMEDLCQREDVAEVVGQLLRQFEAVTKLSAFQEPQKLH
jgi:hypothetical protein